MRVKSVISRTALAGVLAALALAAIACSGGGDKNTPTAVSKSVPDDLASIAAERGLTEADMAAALKTFVPTGKRDEYVMFASGGHSGQMIVIGIPSMRLLKTIAVFTPESWQGYGIGEKHTEEVLAGGDVDGREVRWADTHHPAFSETNGDYDGQFAFINDKNSGRIAVIDLRDFETKQIIKNPVSNMNHGATMVTPDTEWIIEGGQYATPLGGVYAPIDQYKEKYRGTVTFWKFDRAKGRVSIPDSFAIEVPPYWQDLCDAGKKVSEGWIFCNSFNTEMATGGFGAGEGNIPFEAGASMRDTDYLHIINLEKAKEVVAQGKTTEINGFRVIGLDTAASEGILYFAPEPKSPHGVDITPGGEYMVISGKLDPQITVYSFAKVQAAIAKGGWETDEFGVPILALDDVVEQQFEVGLGPLHTQFDDKGYAYTSLFLESKVARWTLGGPYAGLHSEPAWSVVGKVDIHYNVGHIAAAEGDTVSPDGKYLVSLNKWAIDRFTGVGPLIPQNLQLIDISKPGDSMTLLYDMPLGVGEPHYAQIIKADKLQPWEVYPEVGWNAGTQSKDPNAVTQGKERVERRGNTVEIWMTAVRSHYTPEHVKVKPGDHVIWHITNVERATDATHGFALGGHNVSMSLEPGETVTYEFDVQEKEGVYAFYCTEFCSALHLEMAGYFMVER